MKRNSSAITVLIAIGCFLTMVFTILAIVPFLNELFAVQVEETMPPAITAAPMPEAAQEVPVTVYYVMEENSKKIARIYIEVFPVGSDMVLYMEVPVDTRVNLSEDLYKSLQSYGPELPQYLKLSNMAESFSEEYGLTGCNRILSEVTGFLFTEYVRADENTMIQWFAMLNGEKEESGFFNAYAMWLNKTVSSRTTEERWMYYENRKQIDTVFTEMAPGSQDKDGYLLSGKRTKERLEEVILRRSVTEE